MTTMTEVDPYIFKHASFRAKLLVASAGFRSDDWEDLKQEMVMDVLRRAPRFNPARGDWPGFVRIVMRHHAAVLVIRERRRAPEVLSADLINRADDSDADSLDVLDRRVKAGEVDALHFSLDVRRAVESLPVQLRSLAVMLSQMPVQDACRRLGKSRSRVHQMTVQIREAFFRAGLSPRTGSLHRNA